MTGPSAHSAKDRVEINAEAAFNQCIDSQMPNSDMKTDCVKSRNGKETKPTKIVLKLG